MNIVCPYCGDGRVLDQSVHGKPGEMMCALCNKYFDSRIVDGVIQIKKLDFKPEYAPYDIKDKDVMMKIDTDKINAQIQFERKVDEIREQVNILLRKKK